MENNITKKLNLKSYWEKHLSRKTGATKKKSITSSLKMIKKEKGGGGLGGGDTKYTIRLHIEVTYTLVRYQTCCKPSWCTVVGFLYTEFLVHLQWEERVGTGRVFMRNFVSSIFYLFWSKQKVENCTESTNLYFYLQNLVDVQSSAVTLPFPLIMVSKTFK